VLQNSPTARVGSLSLAIAVSVLIFKDELVLARKKPVHLTRGAQVARMSQNDPGCVKTPQARNGLE
jgi:hypothetical protein